MSRTPQTRDDRWDQGDMHEGYGSLPGDLIERGHRVVCTEDRERNGGDTRTRAGRIARDARKAQIIAANRERGR
jgi:hypothetical protein